MNVNQIKCRDFCPICLDEIIDKSQSCSSINSNIPINFCIKSNHSIPSDSKIEIREIEFNQNIIKCSKSFLLNGQSIESIKYNDKEYIYLNKEYINVCDNCIENLRVNIIENIEIELINKVEIKAVAHTSNCEEICFKLIGESKDCIKSIIASNVEVPNIIKCPQKIKIEVENKVTGVVNPDIVFLSPLCGCDGNLEYLLGNVYLTYGVSLYLAAITKNSINVLHKDKLNARIINQFDKCKNSKLT